ncbi:MAG: cell division protein FtsZ [Oscillospiraceae bacterium]|nr:cell division protein FtsZ [Oscillospiraceae bacterium]
MDFGTRIKVVGIGGAGGNAVNRMVRSGMEGVEFIAMNTDNQILQHNAATFKLQLGGKLTGGGGAGGKPEIGQRAAEESSDEIAAAFKGTDMIFLTAGMGGGTGTGASPIVAKIAKEMGILTTAIVTKPFTWEGKRKMETSEIGIANLREFVDAIVVVPNSRLKLISDQPITLANAFEMADNVLRQGVQSISDLINVPGLINLDFADVSAIMKDAGYAHMGVGRATGHNKAEEAALKAIQSPLLDSTISGAKGVIINFTASTEIFIEDIEQAAQMMTDKVHLDANIIWGVILDEAMQDEISITVIATGFDSNQSTAEEDIFMRSRSTGNDLDTVFTDQLDKNNARRNDDWIDEDVFNILKKSINDNNY